MLAAAADGAVEAEEGATAAGGGGLVVGVGLVVEKVGAGIEGMEGEEEGGCMANVAAVPADLCD